MKNKIRIILIILLIINVIILIYLLSMKRKIFIKTENSDEKVYVGSIEINKKIYPTNHYEYEKLFQDNERFKLIYSYIYELIQNIPQLNNQTKNLTEVELKSVYKEKEQLIQIEYGIYNYEDFKTLVNQCKKIENKKYKEVKVLIETLNKNGNNINADFLIEYDDESLKININVNETDDVAKIEMKPLSEV